MIMVKYYAVLAVRIVLWFQRGNTDMFPTYGSRFMKQAVKCGVSHLNGGRLADFRKNLLKGSRPQVRMTLPVFCDLIVTENDTPVILTLTLDFGDKRTDNAGFSGSTQS